MGKNSKFVSDISFIGQWKLHSCIFEQSIVCRTRVWRRDLEDISSKRIFLTKAYILYLQVITPDYKFWVIWKGYQIETSQWVCVFFLNSISNQHQHSYSSSCDVHNSSFCQFYLGSVTSGWLQVKNSNLEWLNWLFFFPSRKMEVV